MSNLNHFITRSHLKTKKEKMKKERNWIRLGYCEATKRKRSNEEKEFVVTKMAIERKARMMDNGEDELKDIVY